MGLQIIATVVTTHNLKKAIVYLDYKHTQRKCFVSTSMQLKIDAVIFNIEAAPHFQ